jgi:DNA gyrase subunit A
VDELEAIAAGARFELRRLDERERILSAVLKGIDLFDDVAAAVRASESQAEVRQSLMTLLDLDQVQAAAVADMQVRMLSAEWRRQLAQEHERVTAEMADAEAIVESPERQRELVGTERGNELAARANR